MKAPIDNYHSAQNSSSKIKTLDAFLTSRRNSSKEKNSNSKSKQEDPMKAKKRLHLKDFSSSQGQISSSVQASLNNFKLLQGKQDSANDSLVDSAPATKPIRANNSEQEVLTIRSDYIEDPKTLLHDSFSNRQLGNLLDTLKQFINDKDLTIINLQHEISRLKRLLESNDIHY